MPTFSSFGLPLAEHLLGLVVCSIFADKLIGGKKKPDWRAESESVCIFHLPQLPLAADPVLLKFRGIMEMVKLVKGCLRERSYKLHKTHES
jgi:hypothetical protein